MSALSSLYEFMTDQNAVATNPVKGVKRPKVDSYKGKTPAIADKEARQLMNLPNEKSLKGLRDRALLGRSSLHGRSIHRQGGERHLLVSTHRLGFCTSSLVYTPGLPITTPRDCYQRIEQTSHAPTWLVDLDYKPADDLLIYAKYAHGYRQGSVSPMAADGFQTFKPEKVDSYEVGSKLSFASAIHGTLDFAGFYNKFSQEQLAVIFSGPDVAEIRASSMPEARASTARKSRRRLKLHTQRRLFLLGIQASIDHRASACSRCRVHRCLIVHEGG